MKYFIKNFIGGMILVLVATIGTVNDWQWWQFALGYLPGWLFLFLGNE